MEKDYFFPDFFFKCPVLLDAGFFGVLAPLKTVEVRVVLFSGKEHVPETFNEALLLSFIMDLQEGFYFFILLGAYLQGIHATTLRGTGRLLYFEWICSP